MLMSALLAVADPLPPTVYTRPGATLAQVESDLRRCRLVTTGPATGAERPDGAARLDNGALAVASPETIEGCMATHGWRIHTLSQREGQRLSRLSPAARRRFLEQLVGRPMR